MKLATRLILLLSVAIIALSTLAATSLYALNQSMMNDRRAEIVNMLKMGMNLLSYYQSLEARGLLTREQAQSAAKTALSQLNNDGISYYWARLPNGLTFIHPNPKVVNTITQGETMKEVVTSVKQVTHIIAEIAVASREQSAGIEQINTGIT